MKDLKGEVENETKKREKLEQELKSLTETKQKLKKEIHHLKANMSDKNSLMVDLIKLVYAMDLYSDSVVELQAPSNVALESMAQFTGDFQREAKNSPALAPFYQKMSTKFQSLKQTMESASQMVEETLRFKGEFYPDVEAVIKALEPSSK
jgi:hypothetical protein